MENIPHYCIQHRFGLPSLVHRGVIVILNEALYPNNKAVYRTNDYNGNPVLFNAELDLCYYTLSNRPSRL